MLIKKMAIDAFGRLRTADPFTTMEYYPSPLSANNSLDRDMWVSDYVGTAPSYDSQNFIKMVNASGAGNYSIRCTKNPIVYQPGKSRLIFMTGVAMTTTGLDNTSYIGIFNVDNSTPPNITEGVYFKTDGVTLYWEEVIQTGTNSVDQSSWNIDIFDGNGPSGKTLTISDVLNTMIWSIDQEWLGVGRIRCGFVIDGVLYYAHEFTHNNISVQYTKTPRMRVSYYIQGSSSNEMRQMCFTSLSEGGFYSSGRRNSITTNNTLVPNSTSQKNVILAMRINPTYVNATFSPVRLSMYFSGSGARHVYYEIQMHSSNGSIGAITGTPPAWNNVTDSVMQYYVGLGDTLYVSTQGYIFSGGYIEGRSDIEFNLSPEESSQPRIIFSQYDTLIITAVGSASNTVGASIDVLEHI